MNKLLNLLIIILFLATLTLPTVYGLILPKHSNRLIETKRLKDKPDKPKNWQQLKNFPTEFNRYYAEHFGFRWALLSPYRVAKYFVGDSPLDTAFFGAQKGWVFYKNKEDGDILGDYRNINQFTAKQMEEFIHHIKQKQSWLAKQGIEYLFVIAPSKHYIHSEKLPNYVHRTQQENLIIQLSNALDKHPELNYINLRLALLQQKKSQLLYFKSDTHWNFYGANIAQFTIAKRLADLFPNLITPYLFSDNEFTENSMIAGDLAKYMGLDKYFKEEKATPVFHKCSKFKKENGRTFDTSCPNTQLKALVFRDSFFTNLQPFMSLYFEESNFIWEKMTFSRAQEYIDKSKPNVVIEEWVDRFLPTSFNPKSEY